MDASASLIEDDRFRALLREVSRRPMLRRELHRHPLPEGASEDEIWRALTLVRRSQAVFSPNFEYDQGGIVRNWHTEPMSLQDSLLKLCLLAHRGSRMHETIRLHEGSRFILYQYVEEILANLKFDGFAHEYESVRSVLLRDRPCRTDADRIALNYHDIMVDLDDYSHERFDVKLIKDLYDRLMCGTNQDDLGDSVKPRFPLSSIDCERPSTDYVLEIVCAVANGSLTEPWQNPIMTSMLINCRFWRLLPFKSCNNMMGSILSRLYLLRQDFPVFTVIPKTGIIDRWANTSEYKGIVDYSFDESHVIEGNDVDWTAYYDCLMRLMLHAANSINSTLESLKETDDRLVSIVIALPCFNHRQREIVQQVILDEGKEIRTSEYAKRFGIVHSTARSDLEQLFELGVLTRRFDQSAIIYQAVDRLDLALDKLADQFGAPVRTES